jgi:hypothetical protein
MPFSKNKNIRISFEDISKFSNWPKKLFSPQTCEVKYKTEKEVLREYQQDKWGELLKQVKKINNPTLFEVEQTYNDLDSIFPCYDQGAFYLTTGKKILKKHLDLYEKILGPHLKTASCLVELGAGFGSKILGLAQQATFSNLQLIACEYTKAGREIIALLASSLKKKILIDYCDLRKLKINASIIPKNSVIFTSYSAHYIPKLSLDFVNFLSKLKPKVVIHFEPCYEYYDERSIYGLMCKRYVELNDYNRNLVSILTQAKNENLISVKSKKNILGSNPFLPISIIEWTPKKIFMN